MINSLFILSFINFTLEAFGSTSPLLQRKKNDVRKLSYCEKLYRILRHPPVPSYQLLWSSSSWLEQTISSFETNSKKKLNHTLIVQGHLFLIDEQLILDVTRNTYITPSQKFPNNTAEIPQIKIKSMIHSLTKHGMLQKSIQVMLRFMDQTFAGSIFRIILSQKVYDLTFSQPNRLIYPEIPSLTFVLDPWEERLSYILYFIEFIKGKKNNQGHPKIKRYIKVKFSINFKNRRCELTHKNHKRINLLRS